MRRLVHALLVGALVAGSSWAVAGPAQAATGFHEGRCTAADVNAVTVAVDFQGLGGTPILRCAFGLRAGDTGKRALEVAQIRRDDVQGGGGFVCRLAGRPSSTETIPTTGNPNYQEMCTSTPPGEAYWSYWVASATGQWQYSTRGVDQQPVTLGGYQGWSFTLNSTTGTPPTFVPNVSGTFRSVPATRLLDSRSTGGAFSSGETRTVKVTGVAGIPADAGAVQLNLTAVGASAAGWLSAFPTGSAPGASSSLNFPRSAATANAAVVKVGTGGRISINAAGGGTVQVIVDVTGYFVGGTASQPGTYVPLNPTRVGDTRQSGGKVPANATRSFRVTGTAGVPTTVGAVAVNITATEPAAGGFLSVVPQGLPASTSMLNFAGGDFAVANSTVATVRTDGSITLLNSSSGATHLIVDVVGWYRPGTSTTRGSFVPITPTRVADTRTTGTPLGYGQIRSFDTGGRGGQNTPAGSAALLNVTAVPRSAGFLSVQPTGSPSSTLNFLAGQIVPNAAVAPIGTRVQNWSDGPLDVILDVVGYYRG